MCSDVPCPSISRKADTSKAMYGKPIRDTLQNLRKTSEAIGKCHICHYCRCEPSSATRDTLREKTNSPNPQMGAIGNSRLLCHYVTVNRAVRSIVGPRYAVHCFCFRQKWVETHWLKPETSKALGSWYHSGVERHKHIQTQDKLHFLFQSLTELKYVEVLFETYLKLELVWSLQVAFTTLFTDLFTATELSLLIASFSVRPVEARCPEGGESGEFVQFCMLKRLKICVIFFQDIF